MYNYAMIDANSVVENVVFATGPTNIPNPNNLLIVDITTIPNVGIGSTYTGGVFSAPPIPQQAVISKLDFVKRFTQTERIAILQASATDFVVQDAQQVLLAADTIDLSDSMTIGYVDYLASKSYIQPARAAVILSTTAT